MKGGTYHDSATLVGDVPDLEARKEQDTDPEGSVRNPRIWICTKRIHNISVADPGCLYRIPDPQHWKYDVEGEPTLTPRPLLGMSLISRPKKSRIRLRFRKAVLGIRESRSVPNYNTGSIEVSCGVGPITTPRPLLGMSLISTPEKSRIRIRKAVLGTRGQH